MTTTEAPPVIARLYYEILGIAPTATAEEIKIAYRKKAKELHPDVNKGRDTTRQFQMVQEAYSVLGSPERRALYDSGNETAARDPRTQATEADFEPFPCSSCGKVSAQPRYLIYHYVFSFLILSFRRDCSGVFCPNCASKKLLWSSFLTAAIGWVGIPWGIVWSIRALFWNLMGGTKPAELNAFILTKQGLHFHNAGNRELAGCVFKDALSFIRKSPRSETAAQCKRIIEQSRINTNLRIQSKWHGVTRTRLFPVLGAALPVCAWIVFFGVMHQTEISDELKKAEVQVNRSAPTMVDTATRLDGATAGPGRRFTYRYTLVSVRSGDVSRESWKEGAAETRSNIVRARELQKFFKQGITLVYQYSGSDGLFVGEIVVRPDEAVAD